MRPLGSSPGKLEARKHSATQAGVRSSFAAHPDCSTLNISACRMCWTLFDFTSGLEYQKALERKEPGRRRERERERKMKKSSLEG